ncbi:MAG TPA: exodeoxyribonuclease VII large subunit [Roseiflexaceae bacterium]|nr:exodeoxyribonuclease VII large subunit [Roseiflexaceae bacterium]
MRLLSVAQLNSYLREMIDADEVLHDLWIEGEVFDFRAPSSGHWYFKLKDGDAVIGAACWRSSVARIGMRPRNGDAVLAHGRVGFYEASGALQLYVDMLQPAGVGLLHAQFEQLKARLAADGLFDESRKRPLPALPRRIGVATSPSGAVIQDILHVLRRRYPLAEVLLAPCRVQGDGAPDSIVEALYALYEQDVDVIIVARGGGSAEDLWAFNEEVVARAAFASPVPLVSGVGHETDITIIDFVADLRAPTPSAAAELVSPRLDDLAELLLHAREQLDDLAAARLAGARADLARLSARMQTLSPAARLARDRQALDDLLRRAATRVAHQVSLRRARLDGLRAQLATLSPLATLERGYAVVRRADDGLVITDPAQAPPDTALEITVREGTLAAKAGSKKAERRSKKG